MVYALDALATPSATRMSYDVRTGCYWSALPGKVTQRLVESEFMLVYILAANQVYMRLAFDRARVVYRCLSNLTVWDSGDVQVTRKSDVIIFHYLVCKYEQQRFSISNCIHGANGDTELTLHFLGFTDRHS
jgi:hypothetical protein